MPCSRQLGHEWNFRKRDRDGPRTCATYRTSVTLRLFSSSARARDGPGTPLGYPNEYEGNPSDVASSKPTTEDHPHRGLVRPPMGSRCSLPAPAAAPKQPEAPPKKRSKAKDSERRGGKDDQHELSQAMLRLWAIETSFLERRGIHVDAPISAISPIAAARAALRQPPCSLTVAAMKPSKKGRYPTSRRLPRPTERSKSSRTKSEEKEHHKRMVRCGPETLCAYLARGSVYRPLANALLRLYVERPDKPAALERLRLMMGDVRPDMEGFKVMEEELSRTQEELEAVITENQRLKWQMDSLDRRPRRKTKSVAVEPEEK